MITVSDWFDTYMKKQELYLLRKLTYDDIHESTRWESFGSISRASDSIISGGTNIGVINSGQYWNKFLSDKSNLRKTATLQLAIGIENTIARAGIARAGITASNLYSLKAGSVISSGIWVPRSEEWLDILTGWGDDPVFVESSVSVAIRDKFARLFEKTIGSKDSPIDYYTTAYNPADLAWNILTTHGGLDSTASTANTDIDYTAWSTWKTACTSVNLSLSGRLTGETIQEAMELIRNLTNSDISVDGSGLVTFLRRAKGAASGSEQSFDTTNAADFVVRLDDSKIVNYCQVFYDYQVAYDLVTNSDMELNANWTSKDTPTTNSRSNEQAHSGTYSRKIVTDAPYEGIYQDVTTVTGLEYTVEAWIYVTTGDARLRVGSTAIYFGEKPSSAGTLLVADTITTFETTAGSSGRLENVQVAISQTSGTANIKCALYDSDTTNGVLIAETQEVVVAATFSGFVTFPFEGTPTVVIGTTYHLAIWTDENVSIATQPGSPGNYRWKAEAYGDWPDPLTYDSNASNKDALIAVYNISDIEGVKVVSPTTIAGWSKQRLRFTAVSTTTRVIVESNLEAASTFYVDDVILKWAGPETFPIESSYTKEDSTSQTNFGKASPEVYQSNAIWHTTLASATTFADRRVAMFKDPLEVVEFTAFMEGQIAELGDIIKVTNAFFSYDDKYFRIYRIPEINLAAATIRLEAADFDDVS